MVERGEFIGLIGPNGAGKTTLLRTMLGLQKPTSGTVERTSATIGYVPQRGLVGTAQVPVSVREVVRMGASDAKTAHAILDRLGLATLAGRRFGELSGGQQQRVLIAKALAGAPDLLILDEPTTGIDEQAQREFFQELEVVRGAGVSIVMVSHDVEAVVAQVTRIMCLNRHMLYDGPPDKFELEDFLPQMYTAGHRALHHRHGADHDATFHARKPKDPKPAQEGK